MKVIRQKLNEKIELKVFINLKKKEDYAELAECFHELGKKKMN
jgi:hypothetical protein